MTRSKSIATRLSEVLLDGRWIANTNYKEQIESVSWAQATQRIGTLNTIAMLTYHVNYYIAGILKVLEGGELDIRDKYSLDMPPVTSEAEWKQLVNEFLANSGNFVTRVAGMKDSKLDSVFVDERYGTYLRNIEGVIEHCYYHLGQISLIKKLVSENAGE